MSPDKKQVPAAIAAVHELEAEAKTPEQEAIVADWRKEIEAERASVVADLGRFSVEGVTDHFVESAEGVVVPQADIAAARAAGEDVSVHATAGRRT